MITSMWRDGRSVFVLLYVADWRAPRPGHTQAATQPKKKVVRPQVNWTTYPIEIFGLLAEKRTGRKVVFFLLNKLLGRSQR